MRSTTFCLPALFLLTPFACTLVFGAEESPEQLARQLLQESGVRGGLIVHLGCGEGELTEALHAGPGFVVHGLDRDPEKIAKSRTRISSRGGYGAVSMDVWRGSRLPYAENLVNLLIIDHAEGLEPEEWSRVLVPNGVALIRETGSGSVDNRGTAVQLAGNRWTRIVKPAAADIDEWTHFLHSANNNAVAQDTRIGPPRRFQWQVGPLWSRNHEHTSSVVAMISGGGRLFYIHDAGLTGITDPRLPERWMLVARDAFNGVLLWERPLPAWRGDEWTTTALRGRPPSVPRRIVIDGDRLYATLSHEAPLEVIDAASGATRDRFVGTENTHEIAVTGSTVLTHQAEPGRKREATREAIVALDAIGGQVLWRFPTRQYVAQSLAADAEYVVFGDGNATVCLSQADGQELWRAEHRVRGGGGRQRTFLLVEDVVVEGDGSGLIARAAGTGQTLWSAGGSGRAMRGEDVFVAQGCVWHAVGDGITGYDLRDGTPRTVLDPSSVQSPGHHLRCYRSKATERFLITQFRGAELISLGDDQHCQNDWIRGACRFGILPANGMLYVPPNPCFCYPGVKLTGLNALAPEASDTSGADLPPTAEKRLTRGPAFAATHGQGAESVEPSEAMSSEAWPTYRHDPQRSGASLCEVDADVSPRWRASLGGVLTPPVSADGKLFVASKEAHAVLALDADDGRTLWRFVAGGRIDSPPTIHGPRVLFGCADGCVYCLRAADGQLAWRFRAAPRERRVMAFNQLESAWRVHGSVLVQDDLVYATAGRSTYLDGGIHVYALRPSTGEVVYSRQLDTWSPTREDAVGEPVVPAYHMDGAHSDLLVGQNGSVYLGQYRMSRELVPQDTPYRMADPERPVEGLDIADRGFTANDPDLESGELQRRSFHRYIEKTHPELVEAYTAKFGGVNLGDREAGRHLMATAGFLDDSWFNRTFWTVSDAWPGWYHAHRGAKCGQLLVVGPQRTYALQVYPTRNRQSPLFTPGEQGYLLVADRDATEPILGDKTRGATKGIGYTRSGPPVWYDWIRIRIRAMALGGSTLFVAGPPDVIDDQDPMASFEGRKGGRLRAINARNGEPLREIPLDVPPVFDGLIVAEGRLFLSTLDGQIICLGGRLSTGQEE